MLINVIAIVLHIFCTTFFTSRCSSWNPDISDIWLGSWKPKQSCECLEQGSSHYSYFHMHEDRVCSQVAQASTGLCKETCL